MYDYSKVGRAEKVGSYSYTHDEYRNNGVHYSKTDKNAYHENRWIDL